MFGIRSFLSLSFAVVFLGFSAQAATNSRSSDLIQIAILLDTSSSMDGLIGQAKDALWKTVNELALSRRNGRPPRLEVALFEYGNDGLTAAEGHIRLIQPLTTDLDAVSDALFKLTTNGGEEFCGMVIDRAVTRLAWSREPAALKMIFIAGNEPFTQGSTDYRKSSKEAIENGIIVNTIFCGSSQEGIDGKWKDGADLADGRYMTIDQNRQAVVINAPQDAEILKLGQELNDTYIAYGQSGVERKEKQKDQDRKAASAGGEMAVQRAMAKAAPQYEAGFASADLVSAVAANSVSLDKMDETLLPGEMKGMSTGQKQKFIEEKSRKRAEITKKIDLLNQQRRNFIIDAQKRSAASDGLDQAMIKAVREEAARKNFEFSR